MDIFGLLKEAAGKENVLLNEPMKNHTSFRTGGNADYFITPADTDSLIKVMKVIKASGMDCLIFGNGSNMLVSDRGIEGAVIHIGKNFSDIEIVKDGMIIGSGALLSAASAEALNNGLSGMEFASGIPGSFGGAVYMNAGAYGSEIKNIVKWVKVLDSNFEEQLFCGDELCLGYRSSVFQKGGYIILEGMVELSKGDKDDIGALMNELNAKRRQKQPLNFASAGSTFKRPEGCFAGKLIEDSGLKGITIGGAQVSEKHAGFIINTGDATTDDILALMEHCRNTVYKKFGVMLEPEVKFVGRA